MKKTATSPLPAAPDQEAATATAPAPQAEITEKAHHEYIPVKKIRVVRNTRKTFDEKFLQELAASIRTQGILQNLVVRPSANGKHYELACGENRLRAAKMAGLTEVPCSVRNLDDHQFLEVQLLENLQRQNVLPTEEAAAFEELLKNGFTAVEIAQKIGTTPQFVAQRAQLTKLIPHWFDKLSEGTLTIGAANELARLPKDIQERGKKEIQEWHAATDDAGRSQISATRVKSWLQNYIFINLHEASFPADDAELVPGCGPCNTCAKRTGTQGLLFADMNGIDNCLDKICFETKKQAFVTRELVRLKEENAELLMVSESMWSSKKTADGTVIGYADYEILEETDTETENFTQAIVTDGMNAGRLVNIKLNKPKVEPADASEERRAAIRKNKIRLRTKELLADAFIEHYANPDTNLKVQEALLNYDIERLLTVGVAEIRKADYQLLVNKYKWTDEPVLDREWRKANLSRMQISYKACLRIELTVRQDLANEYTNKQLEYARLIPDLIDIAAIEQLATDLVDNAPNPNRKGKKQGGSEPAPAPPSAEPITFLTWCRTMAKPENPAQERVLQGILEDPTFPENDGLLLMKLHIEQKGGTLAHQDVLAELYEQFELATKAEEVAA